MYVEVKTMLALLVIHLISVLWASFKVVMEFRGEHRSSVMGAYCYVIFISVLSIVAYAPVVLSWGVPNNVLASIGSAKDMAVIFFVLAMMQLVGRPKVRNW